MNENFSPIDCDLSGVRYDVTRYKGIRYNKFRLYEMPYRMSDDDFVAVFQVLRELRRFDTAGGTGQNRVIRNDVIQFLEHVHLHLQSLWNALLEKQKFSSE